MLFRKDKVANLLTSGFKEVAFFIAHDYQKDAWKTNENLSREWIFLSAQKTEQTKKN